MITCSFKTDDLPSYTQAITQSENEPSYKYVLCAISEC